MRPYKDMVVNETDGKMRYNLIDRSGKVIATDVYLEQSSPITQQGDKVGAKEFNALLNRDDDGNVYPKRGTTIGVTLPAASWNTSKKLSITVDGMTANDTVVFGISDTSTDAAVIQYSAALITAMPKDGSLEFRYAGNKPTSNLSVYIVNLGVMT